MIVCIYFFQSKRSPPSDPEIRANYFKSLLLNGLSLFSIYVFDLVLQPLVRDQQKWLHRNVGWFYQALWLFPVVGMSLYLNVSDTFRLSFASIFALQQRAHHFDVSLTLILQSAWSTGLAKRVFTLQHCSRAAAEPPSTYTGILNSIATSAYRIVMVFTSLVLSFSLRFIPLIGPALGFVFMCWVDA